MDGQGGRGCGDDAGFYSMGERASEVFQNPLQFDESLLGLHSALDLHLPPKSNAPNEILLDGAVAGNREDHPGDLPHATPHLAHLQFENRLGVFARMAEGEPCPGDVRLRRRRPQVAFVDVAPPRDAVAERPEGVPQFAAGHGGDDRWFLLHGIPNGRSEHDKPCLRWHGVVGRRWSAVSDCHRCELACI